MDRSADARTRRLVFTSVVTTIVVALCVVFAILPEAPGLGYSPIEGKQPQDHQPQDHQPETQERAEVVGRDLVPVVGLRSMVESNRHPTQVVVRVEHFDFGTLMADVPVEVRIQAGGASEAVRSLVLRTEGDGAFRVDCAVGDSLSLAAEHAGLTGRLQISVQAKVTEPAVLVLYPDISFSIRVTDHLGQPVCGLALRGVLLGEGDRQHLGWEKGIGTTRSPDGVARFSVDALHAFYFDLAVFKHVMKPPSVEGHLKPRSLLILAPIGAGELVELQTDGIPRLGTLLELQLPPMGRVRAHFVDSQGQAVAGEWSASLSRRVASTDKPKPSHRYQSLSLVKGVAVFEQVSLDAVFVASIWGSSVCAPIEFLGPTASRLEVDVTLRLPVDCALLRGRAVNASGKLWRKQGLSVRQRLRGGEARAWSTRIDEAGGFTLLVPADEVDRVVAFESVEIFATRYSSADKPIPERVSADGAAWLPLRAGITDLGDVTFDTMPLIVAGSVIPAADAPCKNFSLKIEVRSVGGEWRHAPASAEINGGQFRMEGPVAPGEYRLWVIPAARCHIPPDPVPFVPGQTDLEVRLERGHTFALRLRVLEGSEFLQQIPYALRMVPEAGPAWLHGVEDREDGVGVSGYGKSEGNMMVRYWNGLVTGTYRFEVSFGGADSPFYQVPGIGVPGPGGALAQLDVDLRDVLRRVHLQLVTPSGVPAPHPTVGLAYRGQRLGRRSWGRFQDGVVTGLLPGGEFDLFIHAAGYLPVVLRDVGGDREVLLTPSAGTLEVTVKGLQHLPEGVGVRLICHALRRPPEGWLMPTKRPSSWMRSLAGSLRSSPEEDWAARVAVTLDPASATRVAIVRAGAQGFGLELFAEEAAAFARAGAKTARVKGLAPAQADVAVGGVTRLGMQVSEAALAAALAVMDLSPLGAGTVK